MRLVCDVVRVLLRFGSVRLVLCCCGVCVVACVLVCCVALCVWCGPRGVLCVVGVLTACCVAVCWLWCAVLLLRCGVRLCVMFACGCVLVCCICGSVVLVWCDARLLFVVFVLLCYGMV